MTGCFGRTPLPHLKESGPGYVNNRRLALDSSILCPGLFRDQGPELVRVDAGLAQVGIVGVHVEVPHTHLSEVTRVIFVEVDPMMMLSTRVSATSGVLPVLPNPPVSVRHMTPQLPGLLLASGHYNLSCRSESSNKSL